MGLRCRFDTNCALDTYMLSTSLTAECRRGLCCSLSSPLRYRLADFWPISTAEFRERRYQQGRRRRRRSEEFYYDDPLFDADTDLIADSEELDNISDEGEDNA